MFPIYIQLFGKYCPDLNINSLNSILAIHFNNSWIKSYISND